MEQNEHEIEYLYKYCPIDSKDYTKKIITDNELHFSNPVDFNDPFDCRPKFKFHASEDEIKKFFKEYYKENLPQLNREQRRFKVKETMKKKRFENPELNDVIKRSIQNVLNETPICCFSEERKDILMWSHYADKHRGICLQFDGTSHTPFFGEALKVHYQEKYPTINAFTGTDAEKSEKALLVKAEYWGYEAEWRIIYFGKEKGNYEFPEEHLRGIIFGAKISDENKKKVLKWNAARNKSADIYEASIKEDEYGVEIKVFKV